MITHRGRIDVIYIDPPYGKDSMGKFADTNYTNSITRDNLLSMLYPRLMLAKQLLSDEGVIFCSIDDKNHAYLKGLFDEVFGEENFIENFIWLKNATKNLSKTTSTNHEYIICYALKKSCVENIFDFFRIKKIGFDEVQKLLKECEENHLSEKETEAKLKDLYKAHPDWKGIIQYNKVEYRKDYSGNMKYQVYRLSDISSPASSGVGATYDVIHPITGRKCKYPSTGWRFTFATMQEHIKNNLVYFYEDETKVPAYKRFLNTVNTEVQKSYIQDFTDGKKELISIMNNNSSFDNAKPTTLIKTLLQTFPKNAIILDFFAGSGTTGQAVMELNREDGGNRKFILCTNNEETKLNPNGIALDVTSKRLKRIMTGECYDGFNDFKWLEKNEPYNDSLKVLNIESVKNNNRDVFDVIDETLYGMNEFTSIEDKINWICKNFENTQKYLKGE